MPNRYFKVQIISNVVKKDANRNAIEEGLGYPEGWDSHRINVRAYKSKNDKSTDFCICEIRDNHTYYDLIDKLLSDQKVTELSPIAAENLISSIRPKPADIEITLSQKAQTKKAKIENALKSLGLTYRIKER